MKAISDFSVSNQVTETNHYMLLSTLLDFHKLRETSVSSKDFCPVKVIFIEVESYLPSEVEYILLLYIYLLRTGSTLPRLYVTDDM